MRQHQYRDMSNLNAPYDNLSLQGLGSLSGGPFGAISLDDLPDEDPDEDDYPWMKSSENTREVQVAINKKLIADGYGIILTDGILGPRTCGALKMYGATSLVGGACDSQQSIAPVRATGPNTTSPNTNTPVDISPGGGGVPAWVWGLLVAGAAVGVVVVMKKKSGRTITLRSTR